MSIYKVDGDYSKKFKDFVDGQDTNADALSSHKSDYTNPHQVSKSDVGLGNVTNDAQVAQTGGTMTGTLAMSGETAITFGGNYRMVYNDALDTLDIEVIS